MWNWIRETIELGWRMLTDRECFCEECGASVGFVVRKGHPYWVCAKCSGSGQAEAVDLLSETAY